MNPDFRPRWTAEPQRAYPTVAALRCVTCGGTYPASLSGGRAHYRDCEPAPRRALPASAVGMIRFGTVAAAALILVAALVLILAAVAVLTALGAYGVTS